VLVNSLLTQRHLPPAQRRFVSDAELCIRRRQ